MSDGKKAEDFTLRKILAPDVFRLTSIIGKIGVKQAFGALDPETVHAVFDYAEPTMMRDGKPVPLPPSRWTAAQRKADQAHDKATLDFLLGAADTVLIHVGDAMDDIIALLADSYGTDVETISTLDADVFVELLMRYIQRDAFLDFFKAALRRLGALAPRS